MKIIYIKTKKGVAAYIHKYNFKRFHSSINYQSKQSAHAVMFPEKPMNVYLEYLKYVA